MKINIVSSYKNAHKAEGLTVVVDVLRAFTTCCFVFNNEAKRIIPFADIEIAKKMIKTNPECISIGERKGLKLSGFDYGNSPAEMENISFADKTIIFTTSAGSQGIVNAVNSDMIITGAFVNAQAIVNFIKDKNPDILSFIVTDDRYKDNEDYMLVEYIMSCLDGNTINFDKIKKHLYKHPISERFIKKPMTKYSKRDFRLSLDLDRFDFVIGVKKENNNIYLEIV